MKHRLLWLAFVPIALSCDGDPVRVGDALASLSISPDSLTLHVGESETYEVVAVNAVQAEISVELSLSSSNPDVAAVDPSGVVVAISPGVALIIVESGIHADTSYVTVEPAESATGSIWWTGSNSGDGDWNDASNWSPARVPLETDTVFIPAASGPLTLSTDATVAGVIIDPFHESGIAIEAGVTLTVNGDVLGARTGAIKGGQLIMNGEDLRIAGTLPSTQVNGSARVYADYWTPDPYYGPEWDLDVVGDLAIEGIEREGELFIGDTADVRVSADLLIRDAHVVMGETIVTDSVGNWLYTGQLEVGGSAVFDGGDSRGHMTGGILGFMNLTVTSCDALVMDAASAVFVTHGGAIDIACAAADGNRLGSIHFGTGSSQDHVVELAADVWAGAIFMRGSWDTNANQQRFAQFSGDGVALHVTHGTISAARFDGVQLVWSADTSSAELDFEYVFFTDMPSDVAQLAVHHPGADAVLPIEGVRFDTLSAGPYLHAEDTDGAAPLLELLMSVDPGDGEARTTTAGGAIVYWP